MPVDNREGSAKNGLLEERPSMSFAEDDEVRLYTPTGPLSAMMGWVV
jgi:hypothetical protein